MPQIKNIKCTKGDICSVTLDDYSTVNIDLLLLTKNNIEQGSFIEDDILNELVLETEASLAQKESIKMLSRKAYSQKQLSKKLTEKGFSGGACENALNQLIEWGYINDKEYARMFIEHSLLSSKKSKRTILFELKHEVWDSEVCRDALDEFDIDDNERALEIAQRYIRNDVSDEILKKLSGMLSRNGYSWDTIKRTINHFSNVNSFDD